jgi:hypothetical protein
MSYNMNDKEPIMEPVPLYEDDKGMQERGLAVPTESAGVQDDLRKDHFSAGAILRGEAGHIAPTTAFERKAALINL